MKKSDRNALVALPVVVVIAALVAVAGSQGGSTVGGFPVFALCVILAFVIQWARVRAGVPAADRALLRPHRQPDLHRRRGRRPAAVGRDGRSFGTCCWRWSSSGRRASGSYLFLRIRKAGADARFDEIKPSFPRFLSTWTLQGLWVTLTLVRGARRDHDDASA